MSNSKILTDQEVGEIEARADAATKGPWHTAKRRAALVIAEDRARVADCHVGIGMAVDEAQINAEFLAHAREDIPALCATVRQLLSENEKLKAQRERDETCIVCEALLLVDHSEPPHCIDCHPTDEDRER